MSDKWLDFCEKHRLNPEGREIAQAMAAYLRVAGETAHHEHAMRNGIRLALADPKAAQKWLDGFEERLALSLAWMEAAR